MKRLLMLLLIVLLVGGCVNNERPNEGLAQEIGDEDILVFEVIMAEVNELFRNAGLVELKKTARDFSLEIIFAEDNILRTKVYTSTDEPDYFSIELMYYANEENTIPDNVDLALITEVVNKLTGANLAGDYLENFILHNSKGTSITGSTAHEEYGLELRKNTWQVAEKFGHSLIITESEAKRNEKIQKYVVSDACKDYGKIISTIYHRYGYTKWHYLYKEQYSPVGYNYPDDFFEVQLTAHSYDSLDLNPEIIDANVRLYIPDVEVYRNMRQLQNAQLFFAIVNTVSPIKVDVQYIKTLADEKSEKYIYEYALIEGSDEIEKVQETYNLSEYPHVIIDYYYLKKERLSLNFLYYDSDSMVYR